MDLTSENRSMQVRQRGSMPAGCLEVPGGHACNPAPFRGHEGGCFEGKSVILRDVLTPFIATWTRLSVTPERFIAAGDDMVVQGWYRGRHHATGRPMEARFTHTWTFRNSKAIRFEMLADTIQFFRTVDL